VKVLGRYPIRLVKPQSLNLNELTERYPVLGEDGFPEVFFRGIDGYNRLLLSDEFYARYAAYEFILIHQLDAFVFSDRLAYWCGRGYDYIGAPWLPESLPKGIIEGARTWARRFAYRLIDRQSRYGPGAHRAQYEYASGNGGFSLRRVETMRNTLRLLADRAERYRRASYRDGFPEDFFFCVEANRYRRRVRLPGLREALRFAWEANPALALRLNDGELPFGCHAWNKLHRDEWTPIFAKLGIDPDRICDRGP
jgi:hypothetical protein